MFVKVGIPDISNMMVRTTLLAAILALALTGCAVLDSNSIPSPVANPSPTSQSELESAAPAELEQEAESSEAVQSDSSPALLQVSDEERATNEYKEILELVSYGTNDNRFAILSDLIDKNIFTLEELDSIYIDIELGNVQKLADAYFIAYTQK